MSTTLDRTLDSIKSQQLNQLNSVFERLSKTRRNLTTAVDTGQVLKAKKASEDVRALLQESTQIYQQIVEQLDSIQFEHYISSEFEPALFAECRARHLPLSGTFPHYHIASFAFDILANGRTAEINGRRIELGRVKYLIDELLGELSQLDKNSSPPESFVRKLIEMYDLELTASTGRSASELDGIEIPLKKIYLRFIPKQQTRLRYPYRQFAHDIFRLLVSGIQTLEGRRLIFKSGRDRANSLRVMLPNGHEMYYSALSVVRQSSETTDETNA